MEMAVLGTAKVSSDFRVTIPKKAREFLNLKEGEELVFFDVEGKPGRLCFRKTGRK